MNHPNTELEEATPMNAEKRIRLLLVDDDPLIRAGLAAVLGSDPSLEIIGEAENGLRALELVPRLEPKVILLDIRMPHLDGLTTLKRLMARDPQTRVLILTTFGEEAYIDRAMAGGASGFMLKSSAPEALIAAVHAVAEGAAALSPRIARRVIDRVRAIDTAAQAQAMERVAGLTPRENQVLALVGGGFSNAEIASRLVLTQATVKGHMTSIMLKLGARNRVEAALLAYQAGMVDS